MYVLLVDKKTLLPVTSFPYLSIRHVHDKIRQAKANGLNVTAQIHKHFWA